MNKFKIILCRCVLLITIIAASLAASMTNNIIPVTSAENKAAAPNPLLEGWSGPYGGIPPFDKVKVADFKPALETAMADNLAEVRKIADDATEPTFENTIAAMERTGRTLTRFERFTGSGAPT